MDLCDLLEVFQVGAHVVVCEGDNIVLWDWYSFFDKQDAEGTVHLKNHHFDQVFLKCLGEIGYEEDEWCHEHVV